MSQFILKDPEDIHLKFFPFTLVFYILLLSGEQKAKGTGDY